MNMTIKNVEALNRVLTWLKGLDSDTEFNLDAWETCIFGKYVKQHSDTMLCPSSYWVCWEQVFGNANFDETVFDTDYYPSEIVTLDEAINAFEKFIQQLKESKSHAVT